MLQQYFTTIRWADKCKTSLSTSDIQNKILCLLKNRFSLEMLIKSILSLPTEIIEKILGFLTNHEVFCLGMVGNHQLKRTTDVFVIRRGMFFSFSIMYFKYAYCDGFI